MIDIIEATDNIVLLQVIEYFINRFLYPFENIVLTRHRRVNMTLFFVIYNSVYDIED